MYIGLGTLGGSTGLLSGNSQVTVLRKPYYLLSTQNMVTEFKFLSSNQSGVVAVPRLAMYCRSSPFRRLGSGEIWGFPKVRGWSLGSQ